MSNEISMKADVEYGTIKNVYLTIPEDRPYLLCLFIDIELSKGGQVSYLLNSINIIYPLDQNQIGINNMINNIIKLLKKYNVRKLEDIKDFVILCYIIGNQIIKVNIDK